MRSAIATNDARGVPNPRAPSGPSALAGWQVAPRLRYFAAMPSRRGPLSVLLALSVAWVLVAPPATAWNESGHMQVALIAYRRLSPATRSKVIELIKKHPRFSQDFSAKQPDNLQGPEQERQWLFAHAATWPDIARTQAGFHHASWHYINEPIYLSDDDLEAFEASGLTNNVSHTLPANPELDTLNVVQALALAKKNVAAVGTPPAVRALYLTWLMHLVGDVHQPLHTVALYSKRRFPSGDKGGNDILITGKRSLHSTWDGLLGTSDSVGYLASKVSAYLNEPELEQAADEAAKALSVDDWVEESYDLAYDFAYDAAIVAAAEGVDASGSKAKPSTSLAQSYFSESKEHARRRAVQAGARLATLLQKLVR
jgi:hypothetical protein